MPNISHLSSEDSVPSLVATGHALLARDNAPGSGIATVLSRVIGRQPPKSISSPQAVLPRTLPQPAHLEEERAKYTFISSMQYRENNIKLGAPVPLPFPPLAPEELFARRAEFYNTLIRRESSYPPASDTPLRCLYRIYEYIMNCMQIGYRNEFEYFCNRGTLPVAMPGDSENTISWLVSDIPDPQDPDPARYAILAGITELLVTAFNKRIITYNISRDEFTKKTMREKQKRYRWWARWLKDYQLPPLIPEEVPTWAKNVAPLKKPLLVPYWRRGEFVTPSPDVMNDPDHVNPAFLPYNIYMLLPLIHFI